MRKQAAPSPPPTEAALHEAALAHLSRYAASRAGLTRVLDRRCERWTRQVATEEAAAARPALRQVVRDVVARLVAAGAVNDAAFAASRVNSLARTGRSRRAIAAHLAARGVAGDDARAALLDDPDAELAAALALARRRRLGPFRAPDAAADPKRELGVLARAGFSQDIAARALDTDADTAEALVTRLRRG
nr:RecX family transcriptional regulator [uncultured Rhodopila sp.]